MRKFNEVTVAVRAVLAHAVARPTLVAAVRRGLHGSRAAQHGSSALRDEVVRRDPSHKAIEPMMC